MTLDLGHVESFVAVAEARSFSVAAARLGTVQSAVSTHIRMLEDKFGERLVDRGRGKPVELTARGRVFLIDAQRLLAFADEIVGKDRSRTPQPRLRLGTTATFALSVLPQALKAWRNERDSIGVAIQTARSHEVRELLDMGEIDVALILDRGRQIGRIGTRSVPLGWAASEGSSFDPSVDLPLAFLSDARDLRRHAIRALDEVGRTHEIAVHIDPIGLRAAVLSGGAVTVLPKCAITSPLSLAITDPGLPELGEVTVGTYIAQGKSNGDAQRLAQFLLKRVWPS